MSNALKQVEQIQSEPIQASLLKEAAHVPARAPGTDGTPKVVITGDIRLRVTKSYAALRPVEGHYCIETEGMHHPLHVIWIAEGHVLNHTVHAIDVAFDLKGTPAGATLTRLLTAQVTESNGRGNIVHSSVFVQISVVKDDPPLGDTALDNTLLARSGPHSALIEGAEGNTTEKAHNARA